MIVTEATAPPAAGRWELFRALGAVAGDPADARTACAALGWAGPDNAEHTEVFVLNCPPYAAVYLGAEGGLGGDAADRAAGFWRAIGLDAARGAGPPGRPARPVRIARRGGRRRPPAATADALTRACQALFWEHLWPWLPGYLDAVADLRAPGLAPWARLARRALLAERGAHPGGWLPLALRAAPEPGPAPDNLDPLLDLLITPVRSGFILTRRSLAAGVKVAGAGYRIGERRFTLRALLEQDPAGTVSWLAARPRAGPGGTPPRLPGRTAARGGDIVQAWWARRAGHTARILAMTAR